MKQPSSHHLSLVHAQVLEPGIQLRLRNGGPSGLRVQIPPWVPNFLVEIPVIWYSVSTMSRTPRWSDQQLQEAVASSRSIAQTLKHLGLTPSGSSYQLIWSTTKRLDLDTSHWTGKSSNKGPSHVGGPSKLLPEEILVLNRYPNRKESTTRLRKAMIAYGIKEVCDECNQGPTWNEKPLTLHIDHRNGNPVDNRPGNIRFLCPNCHSQTENWGAKNIGQNNVNYYYAGVAKRQTRQSQKLLGEIP